MRRFIELESSAGIILFLVTVLALAIDNTPWAYYYHLVFRAPMHFELGAIASDQPLLIWINDGLMSIFFLLVGLEIKREMLAGELSSVRKALLPGIAAVGGMFLPAFIYVCFNYHDHAALRGWAIPVATDTAFSLGILALLGKRIPQNIKVLLTALAIFDDIGAIAVMAIFYSKHLSLMSLGVSLVLIMALGVLNYWRVRRLWPYLLVGFFLWLSVLHSGVHATLAGIVLAMTIPVEDRASPTTSTLYFLERKLHPWVAFGILPVFAFANAGVNLSGLDWEHLIGTIPLGIILGLFVGKPLGICAASLLAVKTRIAHLPNKVDVGGLFGMSFTAGVGFTMSLFIANLAFAATPLSSFARIGILSGSLISGTMGYWMLRYVYRKTEYQK
ncbi:MAG: Na+/H+ antiporter NhaA [Gammaproteobacteria bacterium RIFCSPHIGHO2_12_FULL_42_13]|nr:MAG: Na+/H+ antiporter NhaA [Gammaproteobacteria bacterium RIFCSPHIGHO2_12_FULL_42_13]